MAFNWMLDEKTRRLVAYIVEKYGKPMQDVDVRSLTATLSQWVIKRRNAFAQENKFFKPPLGDKGGVSGEWRYSDGIIFLNSDRGQRWLREHGFITERN